MLKSENCCWYKSGVLLDELGKTVTLSGCRNSWCTRNSSSLELSLLICKIFRNSVSLGLEKDFDICGITGKCNAKACLPSLSFSLYKRLELLLSASRRKLTEKSLIFATLLWSSLIWRERNQGLLPNSLQDENVEHGARNIETSDWLWRNSVWSKAS